MTLKKLTAHRYFASLSAVDRQTALPMAWNAFIGAEDSGNDRRQGRPHARHDEPSSESQK